MGINWDEMSGNFITLGDGVATRLELKNWRQQDKFKDEKTGLMRFGLTFDVYQENNFTYDATTKKEWTCTARKACEQLKPIIEKAEAAGVAGITISVVKMGEGKSTIYKITDVSAGVPPANDQVVA